MNTSATPTVSVIVATYCHEDYIAQALDSIIMQKTDFPIEVWVGDDTSSDRTPDILREYKRKYPELLHIILRPKNFGPNRNSYDLLRRSRGKYVAFLEGDDYWTDAGKLQKQVDFLEANPQYIGCCHKCLVVDEHGNPNYYAAAHWTNNKKVFTMQDHLDTWETPGQTATVVMRNIFLDKTADYSILYRAHSYVGDKTLMLILLSKGDFYCFNDVMSCYRKVIKNDGKNWFSIHHSNPYWQYDMFIYPCRVESYARKELGLRETVGAKKDFHFTSFLEDTVKAPSRKRIKYIAEMIARSHRPYHYLGLLGRFFIER